MHSEILGAAAAPDQVFEMTQRRRAAAHGQPRARLPLGPRSGPALGGHSRINGRDERERYARIRSMPYGSLRQSLTYPIRLRRTNTELCGASSLKARIINFQRD